MADRDVRKIDEETKVIIAFPHLRGKAGRERRGADQDGLVHIVVKNLQLHAHVLFLRRGAEHAHGFQKLREGELLRLLLPLAREQGEALRAERFRLVEQGEKRSLRCSALGLVDGVGVDAAGELVRLRGKAHAETGLREQRRRGGIVCAVALRFDHIKKVVADDLSQTLHRRGFRIAHPLQRSEPEVIMDRLFHIGSSVK